MIKELKQIIEDNPDIRAEYEKILAVGGLEDVAPILAIYRNLTEKQKEKFLEKVQRIVGEK